MNALLRILFFVLIVRPLVLIVLGMNVRNLNRLPQNGPAIIVANHNSHLDTLILMSLFPLRLLHKIQPVAAEDYFLRNKLLGWFALNIIRIIPIKRGEAVSMEQKLKNVSEILAKGQIIILFPEGSRGEPERLSKFRSGVSFLAEQNQAIPIIPVFIHGAGQSLPKGDWLLVPFFCDVFIGEQLDWPGDRGSFMAQMDFRMKSLAAEGSFPAWE